MNTSLQKVLVYFVVFFLCISFPLRSFAITDPLSVPNNKFGIHILYPSELSDAAALVNSSGGDWGYITIPIQAGDKDLDKWQNFMDQCRQNHLIPLIRLATQGDYFNTQVWSKPTYDDIVDFANFLNSLNWPTKNRYVIIFNEVNRGDEWGGAAEPDEYADMLSFAVTVFKAQSPDFFIISAGLDNAAPQQPPEYYNEYSYLTEMNTHVPGIFNQIDGFASHSYPNPGFIQSPSIVTPKSISSFKYETALVDSMSTKKLPVFITETGWSGDSVSDDQRGNYYVAAFQNVWNDPRIVAVTPFLLRAGAGPFAQFSFLDGNGNKTKQYLSFATITKPKGNPVLSDPPKILGIQTQTQKVYTVKTFPDKLPEKKKAPLSLRESLERAFAWIMKL